MTTVTTEKAQVLVSIEIPKGKDTVASLCEEIMQLVERRGGQVKSLFTRPTDYSSVDTGRLADNNQIEIPPRDLDVT